MRRNICDEESEWFCEGFKKCSMCEQVGMKLGGHQGVFHIVWSWLTFGLFGRGISQILEGLQEFEFCSYAGTLCKRDTEQPLSCLLNSRFN